MNVDLSNVLDERVGSHGLSESDVSDLEEEIEEVHAGFGNEERFEGYGFLELPEETDAESVQDAGDELSEEFGYFVNVGIGGSSLGGATLVSALEPDEYEDSVHFLDNVDPDYLRRLLDRIELENTVVSVVSKSGSTAETVANYLVVREAFEDADLEPRDHTVVTTGDASPLRDVGSRRVFDFPGVPGRYSALSVTGLLPAAFAGVNVEEVLEGGRTAEERCARPSIRDNPGYALGGASYALDRKGRSVTVMMPYSERLETFGEWYAQLWAESLGKRETVDGRVVNAGQTPVKSVGVTDQHSLLQLLVEGPDDKLVTFVDVGEGSDEDFGGDVSIPETHDEVHGYLGGSTLSELRAAELDATQASLVEAGKPSLRVKLRDVSPSEVGQLLYTYEVAVAVAGELHGVNPFNQPGVESGKRATYALLGREGYEGEEGRVEEIKETLFEV